MRLAIEEIPSSLGALLLVSSEKGVCALDFADCRQRMDRLLVRHLGASELVPARGVGGYADALHAYLSGRLDALRDVPVDLRGTRFQERVWEALREIPAGSTRTYGEIARAIGRPTASRAVGAASGRNPVALIVPCHRVVGADGALTGYAGGVERKRWLLTHEGMKV